MIDDERIIELFFERSEEAIQELGNKYGKACHKLSYNIVNNRQDAEECVNDAYLGAWNAIPPEKPDPLLTYLCKIVRNISLKMYYKKGAAKRSSTYTIAMEEIEACIAELLEGAGLAEKPARWSGNIHTEAEQMRTLVEQMLTLARADNGVRPAAMEPLNLSDVATDCVLAFEPVAFEAGKPLEERITADITVVGDADRLRRLISILLDNAVKYGAEGGHITLTLEKTDRQARLTVSNPGDPIPPEHLAHLFERFYRADASRGEKSGFGLGLAIADTIAREHKGVLKAESDTASTRFTFTMPLKK